MRVWDRIAAQRIIFVGGKGGVGKTTIASALAVSLAERGERCLLVSTDPAHSIGDLFDVQVGDRERELLPNLTALEIDPDAQVERHLEAVGRTLREFVRPEMYDEIERHLALTRLSPGAVEAAMLERVAGIMNSATGRYQRVVFDTAPTGHTLRLLSLPEIMSAWTDGLLRRREGADENARDRRIRDTLLERRRTFADARRLLLDRAACAFLLVLIPEKLAILESRKAAEALRGFDIPLAAVVVNRVLPDEPLGAFLEERRGQEARYRREIAEAFESTPRVELPLLPRDVRGADALRPLASLLLS